MAGLARALTARAPRSGAAFLGLLAISVFFAREALFGGRAFFLRDLHLQWFGQVETFVHAIAAGSWPLWDPYVSFGQPMLANANVQVLYPPTWLNLLMRPYSYYTLYFVGHLVLAGIGATALARQWGASEAGAFVAGALWIASGPFLSLGNLWNHLAGAAWMPWTLMAADRALAGSKRGMAGWALAIAATILAGSPDLALLTMVPATALLVARLDWRSPAAEQNRRAVLTAVFAIVIGVGIAAAQVLPSVELARHSIRSTMSPESRTYWSAHPATLAQMLVPMSWDGLPWSAAVRAALFESREPYLLSLYLGLPALVLAACALAGGLTPQRTVLGVSAGLCVALALGSHSLVYSAASALFPLVRAIRYPVKALVPAALCVSLLGGLGFDAWRARRSPGGVVLGLSAVAILAGLAMVAVSRLWPEGVAGLVQVPATASTREALAPAVRAGMRLAALGLAIVLLAIAGGRGPRAARVTAGLLAGLALADLALLHAGLNPTAPRDLFRWRPDALKEVDQSDGRRLFVYDYDVQPGMSRRHLGRDAAYVTPATSGRELWRAALGVRAYPVPPVGAAYGILDSFGRDLLGIQPLPLARLNAALFAAEGTPGFPRLLRIGAVSRVIALHHGGIDGLIPLRRWHGPFFEDVQLFEVTDPLPRYFVVGQSRVGDMETLLDPSFDPATEVVLADAARLSPDRSPHVVRLVEGRADRLRFEVDGTTPGVLVVVDAYDAGWRGRVDGVAAPVLRANVAFRGIAVPPGRHVVEMVYRPSSVILGAITSVASLLGLVAWWRR